MSILMTAILALAGNNEHDLELASALARRGWVELAEDVCGRIDRKQAGLPLVLAEVSFAKARRMADVRMAAKELDTAVERLTRAGRAPTLDERGMTGWLHVQKSKILSAAAAEEAEYRAEAIKSWEATEAYYRASAAEMDKMPANRAVDEALLDARLEIPKAMAAQARVPSIDESRRTKLQQEAVRLFSEFMFVLSRQPVLLEAALEEGRSRADLKDYARAERCFRSLPGLARAVREAGYPAGEYLTGQLHAGVLALADTLTKAGKGKDAAAACDEFLRDNPRLHRSAIGYAVVLAKADAIHPTDEKGAIDLAKKVEEWDPDGAAGRAARKRIQMWTRGAHATPALVMSVADGLIERGQYRDALVELRRCLELSTTAADKAKYEPLVLSRQGECFRALKQELEASVVWRELFRKHPKHELAPRAAFESVRSLSRAGEEELMVKLLDEVEKLNLQGEFAPYLKFIRAEVLERKKQYRAAAELYGQVDEKCEVYDDALVSGGHCHRLDGKPALAEAMLKRVLGRKVSPRLLFPAHYELATITISDRPKEALDHLEKCSGLLPAESPTHARLLESEFQAHLALNDGAAAAARFEKLLARFPDDAATLRSCRRLAARLEAVEPAKAARYYRLSLDRASTTPMTTAEAQAVADGLYRIARSANGMEENVVSMTDLKGNPVKDAASWSDAARAHEVLIQIGGLAPKDAVVASTRLLWCSGLAGEWAKSKTVAEKLIQDHQLLDKEGKLNVEVLKKSLWLLGVYLDYGHSLYQLGKAGQKFQFNNALTVHNNVINATGHASEPWWIGHYMAARIRFERGEGDDLRNAGVALSSLEGNNPGFDGGKHGMAARFVALRDQVKAASGTQR